ncbi:hypothetical protein V6767_20320 [Martelella sp. FLE1502]
MPKIDDRLVELLKKYGESRDAVWDCHGTWIAYHAAIERMAAKAGIEFGLPQMIVNDPDKKMVVICITAKFGDRSEWSFGEASKDNNKNAYPYAMAEKRAKDRVALKLLGMSGFIYSEEEADDFKDSKPSKVQSEPDVQTKSSAQLKREGQWETVSTEIADAMNDVHTFGEFERLKESYRQEAKKNGWNITFMEQLKDLFDGYETDLSKRIEEDNKDAA